MAQRGAGVRFRHEGMCVSECEHITVPKALRGDVDAGMDELLSDWLCAMRT